MARARGKNHVGWGPYSAESQVLIPDHAIKCQTTTHDSFTLSWTPHPLLPCNYYDLQRKIITLQGGLDTESADFVTILQGIPEATIHINQLIPATTYQFRVRSHYEGLKESWENEARYSGHIRTSNHVPSPPLPPTFDQGLVTESTAVICWQPTSANGNPIVEYELEMSYKLGLWESMVQTEVTTVLLEELPANRRIYFRVRARNALGWSPFSKENETPLEIFVVPPPSAPTAVALGTDYITLVFEPPHGFLIDR